MGEVSLVRERDNNNSRQYVQGRIITNRLFIIVIRECITDFFDFMTVDGNWKCWRLEVADYMRCLVLPLQGKNISPNTSSSTGSLGDSNQPKDTERITAFSECLGSHEDNSLPPMRGDGT